MNILLAKNQTLVCHIVRVYFFCYNQLRYRVTFLIYMCVSARAHARACWK